MKATVKVVGLIVGSWLLSVGWWNLWMYHGFLGSPGVIKRLMHADGEDSYDATQVEMFVIIVLALMLIYKVWEIRGRKNQIKT